MRSKWIQQIFSFFVFLTLITSNTIADDLLHGPALEQTNVSSTEGYIIVYREDDGDVKHVPTIFIDDDVMGSLLPNEFAQSKICTGDIKLRVASRGGVVSAGQPQMIQIHKGKITYVKITKTEDKTFMPVIVDEVQGQQALAKIKTTSNIINRFVAQVKFDADSLFEFNSAKLMHSASRTLDVLTQDIKACPNQIKHIQIIGHTDRIGSKAYNKELSAKRAKAVADYLTKHGITIPISIEGRGSSEPVTTNCRGRFSPALIRCLQPDRRVVVKLLNGDNKY